MLFKTIKNTAVVALTFTALFSASAHAGYNLIENGSFETPDIDSVIGKRGSTSSTWQYYDASDVDGFSGSNIEIWNSGFQGVEAWDGGQFMELNSHPTPAGAFTVYQTFDTQIGQTYSLDFAYRARRSNNEAFNVNVAGTGSLIDTTLTDHERGFWSRFTSFFTADSAQTTLKFTSVTPETRTVGNFIDGVSVKSVPEIDASSSGIALGLLLSLIAVFREKKFRTKN